MMLFRESMLEIVLLILGIIITRYLVPYLKEKYTAQKVDNIYTEVKKAVEAMSKIYVESGMGPTRKEDVIEYIRSKGIKISDEDLDIYIESAVKLLDLLEAEIKQKAIEK